MTTIVRPVPVGFVIKKQLGVAWPSVVDAISFLFIIGAWWKLPEHQASDSAESDVARESGGIA